ncbi:MAG: carboxypeptidase regulatory-like domain-containing protein [Blastocatellia bacterium]|nr:carboxypeptidase regulatory-like domain-containing protein [Blastocatellia bacterium]
MLFGFRVLSLSFVLLFACLIGNAATFTVTKVADTNDGTCDGDCSLREAIAAATAAAGDDTIIFSTLFTTPQTIVLSGSELVLGSNGATTINGPGASLLTISGNNASRIISTGANVIATLDGITFTAGNGAGALNTGRGGAIYNVGGTLTITNSIITGNTAANGGGLNNAASTGPAVNANLTISNCIVSNNTTPGSGGGMQNFSTSNVTIDRSTFMGNTSNGSTGGGGGQFNGGVRITNSTFANNSAPVGFGGGMQSNGTLGTVLTNVTFSGNSSLNGGGGIHRGTTSPTFWIRNSIVANNTAAAVPVDVGNSTGGLISEGNNIIGAIGSSTGWIMSDQQNVNPMLGTLANNGGFGMTFVPMAGSPAINMGNNCVLTSTCTANNPPSNVTTDQRGTSRPQGATVDVGSVEVVSAPTFANVSGRVVTSAGNPVNNATVIMTVTSLGGGELGVVAYRAKTSSFGYFSFTGIQAGVTYSVTVAAKGQTFTPQNVPVNGDVSGIVLTTTPQ